MNRIKLSSINISALIVLTVLSHALFAQKADINQKQSVLEWTGKKITGEHYNTPQNLDHMLS